MAKETTKPATAPKLNAETARAALKLRMAEIALSGVRLSAEKSWLRPAIEGAITSKIDKALGELDDAQCLLVETFFVNAI